MPYAVDLKEILSDNHTSFKEADSLPLLPVFTGEGDDLRILYYKVDIMVFKADVEKDRSKPVPDGFFKYGRYIRYSRPIETTDEDSGTLTEHVHPEGHTHGTSAPE